MPPRALNQNLRASLRCLASPPPSGSKAACTASDASASTPLSRAPAPAAPPSSSAGSSSAADEEARERERQKREKLERDEAKKNEFMEKQKLLNLLENPLVSLLDRLGARDELSLPLAQHEMYSLKALRGCDHVELAKALAAEQGDRPDAGGATRGERLRRMVQLLSKAVDMARRDLAIAAINLLLLPDDVTFQKAALAALHEQRGSADASRTSMYQQKDKHQMREEDIAQLRDKDGALRNALLKVTEHWQDYLASQPAFAARLAADETGPTWKDTVAWALWMLTAPFANVHAPWMSKEQIHQCLNYAREHVWFALYPQMRHQRPGEWRLYWVRVESNFTAFYSDKGRNRWMEAAACTARAEAVREGKSSDEQEAAAMQAAQKVMGILHQPFHLKPASPRKVPELPPELRSPVRARSSPLRQRRGPPAEPRGRLRIQSSAQATQRRTKSARELNPRATSSSNATPAGSARRGRRESVTTLGRRESVTTLDLRLGLAVKGAKDLSARQHRCVVRA